MNIFYNIFKFFGRSIESIIRMVVVGLASVGFLILTIDHLTSSAFGVNNLVLIVSMFTFIPIFLVLFVEIFIWDMRRKKRNAKEKEVEFLDL